MNLLRGAVRKYAWGSRTAIAEFTGRQSPTQHPEAELWFGAHPGDSAHCVTDEGERSLLDVIGADPAGQLGEGARARFGDGLPFLAKVLAADEPLSLQAHPSSQQAVHGFEREERLGIPVSAPTRNYRDASHKPELIVALGQFEAKYSRMRRVLRQICAPILSKRERIVEALQLASSVPCSAIARKRVINVYASAAIIRRIWLALNRWQLARVPNRSSCASLMRFSASPRAQ